MSILNDMNQTLSEPALLAEAGWTALEVPALYDPARSYVSGDATGERLRVRYFRRGADGEMLGKVWFGPRCEGPPGHAHGGSICALMDEAMGGCAWMNGHTVVAARVTVNFRRPVPLGTEAWFRAFVEEVKGRKIFARAMVTTANETEIYADAEGLFVVIDAERMRSEDPRVKALFDAARSR